MPQITDAHPILASLNFGETIAFYQKLRFTRANRHDDYLIVQRDGVQLHFWKCDERKIAENTGCSVRVDDADALYDEFVASGVKCAPPEDRPWGLREFYVIDCHGNLLRIGAPTRAE